MKGSPSTVPRRSKIQQFDVRTLQCGRNSKISLPVTENATKKTIASSIYKLPKASPKPTFQSDKKLDSPPEKVEKSFEAREVNQKFTLERSENKSSN